MVREASLKRRRGKRFQAEKGWCKGPEAGKTLVCSGTAGRTLWLEQEKLEMRWDRRAGQGLDLGGPEGQVESLDFILRRWGALGAGAGVV